MLQGVDVAARVGLFIFERFDARFGGWVCGGFGDWGLDGFVLVGCSGVDEVLLVGRILGVCTN
jgi:hypothetical protein